jgi:toxin secretion/phage lysis holin
MNWDKILSLAIGSIGSIAGFLFGGWSFLLTFLAIATVVDYITGIWAGSKEGKLSSKVGFKNIPKKVMIFVLVAIAHMLDTALGENHLFRDATIFFYLSNELLSILENTGRMGVAVPDQLKRAIQVLKDKGGNK